MTHERLQVYEVPVEAGAHCEGKRVKEIAWPANSLLVSLRSGRKVLIPHGDTVLKAEDILVVVVDGSSEEQIVRLCRTARRS